MWREGQYSGVPIRQQRSVCNLSSTQLDLQRPESAVCVCGCKGLRGSATEACVDIWFEKSCPPPPLLPPQLSSLQQLSALTSAPRRFLAFETESQRKRACEGEGEGALMFVFLCIDRSQNYSKSDLKAPPSVKRRFEVIWKCVFQILSEIWGLSWVPRPHSNFKVPPLKPLVNGENKLSFLACIVVTPTLCLLSGDK